MNVNYLSNTQLSLSNIHSYNYRVHDDHRVHDEMILKDFSMIFFIGFMTR